jgi:GT2 family glycosyltransferase/glycosyltransferase involved in cell wall biosynthesis
VNNSELKNSAVCIAGAHRSGTSMLTRLLHVCGLDLGPETDLMPARPDNPDGFWENLRFVSLNDELLGELGGAWDLPPRRDEDFGDPCLEPLRVKARLLVGGFDRGSAWGWKDPRNSLTLPFWKSILPGLKTVVIVRNPLEVAHSMRERNGTSYSFGLRLWEIYNRRIIETTTAEERLLTQYDFFFENSESELRRIADFIGLSHSEASRAATLVATGRRHTHFTMDQLVDARVSAEVIDFYRQLLDGANRNLLRGDPLPGRSEGEEGEVRPHVTPHAVRSGEEDLLPGTVSRVRASIPEREAKLADLTVHLARQDGRIQEMDATIERLDQMLQREQERLRHANEQRARDTAEIENIRGRFIQTNQLLQKFSIRLTDFESRNVSLSERLRKQLLEMKRLLRLLDQIDDAAGLLRRSRRWKLANPFAALWASLTGKALAGFGHLDKNVEKYRSWRLTHPEVDTLAEEIQALRPREIPSPPAVVELENAAKPAFAVATRPPLPTAPIAFAQHDEVEVSIIIPVCNQVDFTRACLAAVQQHSDGVPYEVIVVDDASTDATSEIISRIPGITCLQAEANAGFIASCNRGAKAARGKYLLFLNNDTIVTAGWLTALHETFEFEPEAGLVGSKLIYPDGRLQEAGGIIWRDGSGWNRGKFQDPSEPKYNYMREVDYCSAASVMISKVLFDRLGGFDPKYAPAYYEDTDLAFKVKQSGRKVLYQPLSVVVHYEGATGGTDTSSGTKKYQDINRATFTTAWMTVLADKPENGDLVSFESAKPGEKRILVIDHHLPMPDRDSGSLRMFQILSILHRLGHHVTFLPDNLADIPPYADELRKRGIEVVHYPYTKTVRDYLQREGTAFDLVILSRCDFARKHIRDVRRHAPQSRVVFDTVDLHFLRQDREADLVGDPELKRQAQEKRDLEYELIDQADETWVVSPAEQKLLRLARPKKSIEVVSNIVDATGFPVPFSMRRDMLFIGSFQHPPNIDAILYFTREIFPLIRGQLPGVKFYIIGDKAPPEVISLSDEDIVVTGYQPDVNCYFDRIKLSVAPLRFGAGVKGKVNQSMGFGVPVVATSIAIEGMDLQNRLDVLVANDPEAFASALIELYQSEELWQRISTNSLRKTKESYSVEAARTQLRRLISNEETFPSTPQVTNGVAPGIELGAVGAQR